MTEPVTFGHLLDQARHHLDAAGRIPGRPANELDLLDATRGMHEVITVISQYFGDILTGYPKKPDRRKRAEDRAPESVVQWAAAFLQARRAAISAAYYIEPNTVLRPTGAFATERGQHLNKAALALVAGRDLLHMHTVTRSDGKREERSSWALIIDAPTSRQAIAAEIAALARRAAAVGTALVAVPMIPWDQTTDSRKAMHNASRFLRSLHGAIQAARQQDPVEAADRELVRAVPVRITPTERLPEGTESIANLCSGVLTAAERLRQSARLAAERNFRSPDLNAESLRRAAAASVVANDNCAVVLAALADVPGLAQSDVATAGLTAAVASAVHARDSWLHVTHALGQFTSDMDGRICAEATDANGLALWTGRLAYTDPAWTPANSPSRGTRSPAEFTTTPDVAAAVVAAVHHASDSLQHLAAAGQQQAQLAAHGHRLLVPTASLQAGHYIASRYTPAPPYRAHQLIADYQTAATASRQTTASVATIAEMTNAASRTLTRAAQVAHDQNDLGEYRRNAPRSRQPAEYHERDLPGPVERSLEDLGVVDQRQLKHAAAIDRAGEQLILDSCAMLNTARDVRVKVVSSTDRLRNISVTGRAFCPRGSRSGELEREP